MTGFLSGAPAELTILLVEDDPDVRASLCDVLELDGYTIWQGDSFGQALQLASQAAFDVVILDRQLPDGQLDSFLPELKTLLPATDFIVVTGYADMSSTLAALRMGVSDYLIKPIHPDALRSSLQRIVQRRQIELQLRREHEFANRIIETAEAVILMLDLEGRVIHFNSYFSTITGWTLESLQGKDWFDTCIFPADRRWLRECFSETCQRNSTDAIINAIRTCDDDQRQIRWSSTSLRDEQGTLTGVLAIGLDVTALLAAQQQALQSQRLAAIGQTMTALAHESRNALQRIQAGVEILELEMEPNPEAMKDLRSIRRATRDLHELLEEVRQFAAPIVLQREPVSLIDCCRRVWHDLSHLHRARDAQLRIDPCSGDFNVSGDRSRLEQVFRNLFENSLSACTDPCCIEVRLQALPDAIQEIIVSDNGVGLQADQQAKLFEPFFTTKTTGTGLGMAIVKRVVEAHEGSIELITDPQQCVLSGANLRVRLPSVTSRSVNDQS